MNTNKTTEFDRQMMRRCFQLAQNGLGRVAPNPMVGSVITYESKIIGEGFHRKYGEAHAEVNAINSVKDKSLLKNATLYVNLEPCSHYGKTPPCADLIIANNIPKVVISNMDPHRKVAGKGIEKMQNAGIEVTQGLLKQEGRFLNRRFFMLHEQQRPWIILKWAESMDGFVDIDRLIENEKKPTWLTNQTAKHIVHKWRGEEQAILIGNRTAILDNPQLNVREWAGQNPLRILIDPQLKAGTTNHIFSDITTTLIFNNIKNEVRGTNTFIKTDGNTPIIHQIIKELYARNIQSVIIEGGTIVLNHFIENNLWDEAQRFVGEIHLGNGIRAPQFKAQPTKSVHLGNNTLFTYFHKNTDWNCAETT
ncbi:MAG: bifunctional diaminohydroxyphosphoribosylaminopyrimidine deaminase/5-amino-6-(5-phosphoribosylamino)uracil reductase RibD [Salinivirgaceae bacterium]|jgi:diaminohydroxyphosphoribosylaminopyrimidine deaminase/5-amino-6-(5-phosphoribosylamino)uracil reductase|nr:bifunctional diaminohydroxyphosphoribosylaminopyrimidine deaminase/5-amino-6-(5-phosphoribosylamino)uracil reductase RibD [Salinivirgaceae bacterium]